MLMTMLILLVGCSTENTQAEPTIVNETECTKKLLGYPIPGEIYELHTHIESDNTITEYSEENSTQP